MATAILVQVADAVVELLNGATFSQPIEARRRYPDIKKQLPELGTLRVDVVGTSHPASELGTRNSTQYECRVTIVIRKRFAESDEQSEGEDGRPISNEAVDALVLLVEEIHEYLCQEGGNRRLTNDLSLDATWDSTTIQNTYIDQHLQDWGQFTGILRAVYTARKLVTP